MRKEKTLLLDEIKEKVDQAHSFVLVAYKGLKANDAMLFRRKLAIVGAEYEVVRKKMFLKAAQDLNVPISFEGFNGHLGVVFAHEDPMDATKSVFEYGKENENRLEVIAARIDGRIYDGSQALALSKLPGKDEMRAQLLGLFEAPMAQTLSVMEALVASVIYCLDNQAKKG